MGIYGDRARKVFEVQPNHDIEALIVFSPENRRYLTGFTGSSGYVLVTPQARFLFTDFRYTEQAEMEAPEFQIVLHERDVFQHIVRVMETLGVRRVGFESQKVSVDQFSGLTSRAGNMTWVPTKNLVETLRIIKTPDEISLIQQAAAIADQALSAIHSLIEAGRKEIELALELEFNMRRLGAQRLAFDTIVASGPRGSLPHGHPTDREIQDGDLVTIDFGAYFQGYNSDETVTFAVGTGPERARQKEIYDIVLQAQNAGIAAIKPGVLASHVDNASRSIIKTQGYGEYFGHSTGHGVGLEVHEQPWIAPNPPYDFVLEPGMVITVEPGIYLPNFGGVRLEDTLVVTVDGSRRLTGASKAFQVFE